MSLGRSLAKNPSLQPFGLSLYVCDLSKLRELMEHARSGILIPWSEPFFPSHFSGCRRPCMIEIELTRQSPPHYPAASTSNSSPRPPRRRCLNRPFQPTRVARERDQSRYLFTRRELHKVAHIYPQALINPNQYLNMEQSIPEFWKLLWFFFDLNCLQ